MKPVLAVLSILLFTVCDFALAKDIPVQARLFAGSTSVDPQNLNSELTAQGLKKMNSITQFGVEVSYPALKFFDVGIRYNKRIALQDELVAASSTEYKAEINQDSALLIGRVPFFKSTFVRMDGFAGIGGSNTTLKMKTASQDGELSRKDSSGWFASPYASYGGSVAIGYKQFYLVIEGGVETNKVTNLKRTGTMNGNINTIDFSGSFFTVGLLFDGISATKK